MDTTSLTPTLWRTCRVLAHADRLRLLAAVCASPHTTVTQAAAATNLPVAKVSLGLRALQARGLLAVTRRSRWVCYTARHDPLVEHAQEILGATRRAFTRAEDFHAMCKAFTAFTHPRRLTIVAALAQQPRDCEALAATCHISLPAVRRHVAKLLRRDIVTAGDDGSYCLNPSPGDLARDLVAIVLGRRA